VPEIPGTPTLTLLGNLIERFLAGWFLHARGAHRTPFLGPYSRGVAKGAFDRDDDPSCNLHADVEAAKLRHRNRARRKLRLQPLPNSRNDRFRSWSDNSDRHELFVLSGATMEMKPTLAAGLSRAERGHTRNTNLNFTHGSTLKNGLRITKFPPPFQGI